MLTRLDLGSRSSGLVLSFGRGPANHVAQATTSLERPSSDDSGKHHDIPGAKGYL
jgi:hypothetical protein